MGGGEKGVRWERSRWVGVPACRLRSMHLSVAMLPDATPMERGHGLFFYSNQATTTRVAWWAGGLPIGIGF